MIVSQKLGFLTGEENKTLQGLHCAALEAVAEPFGFNGYFDFST